MDTMRCGSLMATGLGILCSILLGTSKTVPLILFSAPSAVVLLACLHSELKKSLSLTFVMIEVTSATLFILFLSDLYFESRKKIP